MDISGTIPNVRVERRECRGCASSIAICPNNITVEFFTLEKIIDTTITQKTTKILPQTVNQRGKYGENSSLSKQNIQDFLFETWWVKNRPPDVIFHQAATTHEVKNYNLDEYSIAHQEFFESLSFFMQTHRALYFWSNSPKVWPPKLPEKWRNITTNEKILEYNSVVKKLIPLSKDIRLGLDLYTESLDLNGTHYQDGVHHKGPWYTFVARLLIQMYCTVRNV